MTGTGPRKRGRPASPIPKKPTVTLLPLAVREACEREVATGGWGSLSDYLLSVVAPAIGMPEQAPEPKFAPVEDQENLPLTG